MLPHTGRPPSPVLSNTRPGRQEPERRLGKTRVPVFCTLLISATISTLKFFFVVLKLIETT